MCKLDRETLHSAHCRAKSTLSEWNYETLMVSVPRLQRLPPGHLDDALMSNKHYHGSCELLRLSQSVKCDIFSILRYKPNNLKLVRQ